MHCFYTHEGDQTAKQRDVMMSSGSSNTDSQSESGHRHILCPAEVRGTSHGPRASNINTQEPVLGLFMNMNESLQTHTNTLPCKVLTVPMILDQKLKTTQI